MIRTILPSLAIALTALPASARETVEMRAEESATAPAIPTPDVGLAIGQTVPHVELVRADGVIADLPELMGERGAAIVFVRSVDWCPYCQKQLKQIDEIAGELSELGWPLVAVSYDDSELLAEFSEKHGLSYEFASDPESQAIKDFNLLNEGMTPGSRYYGVPHPAIFFVDTDRSVRAVLREESYKDRPAMEIVLHIAAQL